MIARIIEQVWKNKWFFWELKNRIIEGKKFSCLLTTIPTQVCSYMYNKSEVVPSLLNATSTYIGMVVRLMLLILPLLLVCILCNCLISRDTWQYQHLCNQIFAVFNLDHILVYKDHYSKFYIILLKTILVCCHRSPIIYIYIYIYIYIKHSTVIYDVIC